MPVWIRNYIKFLIAACLIVSFCVVEGDAQSAGKSGLDGARRQRQNP